MALTALRVLLWILAGSMGLITLLFLVQICLLCFDYLRDRKKRILDSKLKDSYHDRFFLTGLFFGFFAIACIFFVWIANIV